MAIASQNSSHKQQVIQESIFIPINSKEKLHLKRIYTSKESSPVFLLHGLMSNGKVFYTESGKGLASYLALNGFDVFIPDLRGCGQSTPALNRDSLYGQTEAITQDIPFFIEQIVKIKGNVPQHWIAHSWGGVLLVSCYARFPEFQKKVQSLTFLASRRRVKISSLRKFFVFNWLLS